MQSIIKKASVLLITVAVVGAGIGAASTVFAQTSSEGDTPTATNTPVASTSTSADSESISHGELHLNLDVPKRISSSPARFEDLDINPETVLNENLLEVYARHLALTEPIDLIDISDEEVITEIDGPAKLFGFIPVGTTYRVEVELDPQLEDVTVTQPDSWGWLATKKQSDVVVSQIAANIDAAEYISETQLKAYVLQATVQAVEEGGN